MKTKEQFYQYLLKQGKSKSTATIYLATLALFEKDHQNYSFEAISCWKEWLIQRYKPATVNLRIQAINSFLTFNKASFKIKPLSIQPQHYVNAALSREHYEKLLKGLKQDGKGTWYAAVKLLATTGVRVSEFLQITLYDVRQGYVDIIGKGSKARRIWIPKKVQKEITSLNLPEGPIINQNSDFIRFNLKKFGVKYSIPLNVMHPHEFRSFYAREVYAKTKDLRLLQNLLGHSNVQTTMRYLRQTSSAVGDQLSEIVTW